MTTDRSMKPQPQDANPAIRPETHAPMPQAGTAKVAKAAVKLTSKRPRDLSPQELDNLIPTLL